MTKFVTVTDISNPGNALSQEFGPNIPAGSEVDLEDSYSKRLLSLGAIKSKKDAAAAAKEEDITATTPELSNELPDDLNILKNIADSFEIPYPQNIGVAKLKEKIEAHREEQNNSAADTEQQQQENENK